MRRRSTTATIAIRAASSPCCGWTHRMPASPCSSTSSTSTGAAASGRAATRSRSTPSHRAPMLSRTAAMLAATWLLASSAISATCSPGWMARQTSTAFRAPASRSGDAAPKSERFITTILLGTDDERRNLAAAGRHVGEAGRTQARQKPREASAKDIGCKIDEHVARTRTPRRTAIAHRKPLAAHRDALLCHPAAIALGERSRNRSVPVRFTGLPTQRDSGAAVLVVRLDDEPIARCAQEPDQVCRRSVARDGPLLHHGRPGDVPANQFPLLSREQRRVTRVGQHGKKRLLVRDLAPE